LLLRESGRLGTTRAFRVPYSVGKLDWWDGWSFCLPGDVILGRYLQQIVPYVVLSALSYGAFDCKAFCAIFLLAFRSVCPITTLSPKS
jgi:hypothetical protein